MTAEAKLTNEKRYEILWRENRRRRGKSVGSLQDLGRPTPLKTEPANSPERLTTSTFTGHQGPCPQPQTPIVAISTKSGRSVKKIDVQKFQSQIFNHDKDNRHTQKEQDFTILLSDPACHVKVKKIKVEEEIARENEVVRRPDGKKGQNNAGRPSRFLAKQI